MSDSEANSGIDGSSSGADATDATKELLGDMTDAQAVMFYGLLTWILTGCYYLLPKFLTSLFGAAGEFGWIINHLGIY